MSALPSPLAPPADLSTKVVLTIAGSDCSAGAGIQADIKTAGVLGVFAATAITAITAQNSYQLSDVFVLPLEQLIAQLHAVKNGLRISAVKLGMLGNAEIASAVAQFLTELRQPQPSLPIVVDPVIRATSGGDLTDAASLRIYRQALLPLATVITPNLSEAALLLDQPSAHNTTAMERQATELLQMGCAAVLLKGGHLTGGNTHEQQLATDILADSQGLFPFSTARLDAQHTHGGGCSLAMAIAAGLAQGLSLRQAVAAAKSFIQGAIAHSPRLQLAERNGPLHHFYSYW